MAKRIGGIIGTIIAFSIIVVGFIIGAGLLVALAGLVWIGALEVLKFIF